MSMLLHETLYRGPEALAQLAQARVTVCGAGALGSQLVDNLARHGLRQLTVIDMDRVEEHNIGTQVYDLSDVGAYKVDVLRARCFRATGVEIEAARRQLTAANVARLLRGSGLVLDTFDNSASRGLVAEHCRASGLECLHLGVNGDYGEVRWNDRYRVPGDARHGDACNYPLARNLLLFIVAIGSEAIVRYLTCGEKRQHSFTLRDLSINPEK